MSNLSDDTLRKILQQIQTQAVSSQKSLSITRTQLQSKEKEKKILELTVRELSTVPQDRKMYKGIGKMFISQPRAEIDKSHSTQQKLISEEVANLTKKGKYLEKQFEEANNQLKDIFHSQQREQ